MTARRAVLSVPASEPAKIAKALASAADEVVIDLEDAVAIASKVDARRNLAGLQPRTSGTIAVRVNALDTGWARDDVAAVAANPAIASIVVPKVESAAQLALLDASLAGADSGAVEGRGRRLSVQALIETALGVVNAVEISRASPRLEAIIIGYADLAASLGRRVSESWLYAQDAVIFAARAAGVQAIDGPALSVGDDEPFASGVESAVARGFDGKWVIHPRQIRTVLDAFTPSDAERQNAQDILDAMHAAKADGRGAVEWQGQMLDEAVVAQARRLLSRFGRG